jgi:hypothetical protein
MILTGILVLCFSAWGAMTGGWSSRSPDYQSVLLTIYGYILQGYIPAFILMLIRLRAGIIAFWCLIALGGILFCASGFKDGAMIVSLYSIVIPLLGRYVQRLNER